YSIRFIIECTVNNVIQKFIWMQFLTERLNHIQCLCSSRFRKNSQRRVISTILLPHCEINPEENLKFAMIKEIIVQRFIVGEFIWFENLSFFVDWIVHVLSRKRFRTLIPFPLV